MSCVGTKVDYSENYYDVGGIARYKYNLASISVSNLGNKVRLKCRSGSCISYEYKDREKEETKKLSYIDLEAKSVSQLYKAFVHLKKVCGL